MTKLKAREQGGDFFEKCDREMKRLAGELVDRANDVPPDADGIIEIAQELIGIAKASKL